MVEDRNVGKWSHQMVAKTAKAGFVFKSALLGASMLTLAGMAMAETTSPAAPTAPAHAVTTSTTTAPTTTTSTTAAPATTAPIAAPATAPKAAVAAPGATDKSAAEKAPTDKVPTLRTDKMDKSGSEKPNKVTLATEPHRLSGAVEAAYEKVKSATVVAKETLTKDGKALLAAVDDEIAAVKKKYDGASTEAKEHWGKQATTLKTARDKLAQQIEALNAAKAENWEAARKGVENAYRDLSAGVSAALGKLKA